MYLTELILKSSESALRKKRKNGSFRAGHNGPWYDLDTPVRNTAHWAVTLYKAYEISDDERFLQNAISACDYLLSKDARPFGEAFFCRKSKKKNQCNGLIGQAWAIEPLIIIGSKLGHQGYLDLSQEVLLKHKYDMEMHLWKNLGVKGELNSINMTFNQQLWFAALSLIVGQRCKNQILLNRAKDFFEYLTQTMNFLEPGLVQHDISPNIFSQTCNILKFSMLKNWLVDIAPSKQLNQARELAIGYLPFNLYGFALAYEESREEDFWQKTWLRNTIKEMLSYVQTETYYRESHANKYAWSYNPIGFEIAYALYIFKDIDQRNGNFGAIRNWIERQIKNNWSPISGLMKRNADDPETLSARLYEATRLPDIELNLTKISEPTKATKTTAY